MKRRVLSLLLALTLCFSLLPVSAMAEDTAVSPSPTAAATAPAEVKKDEPAPTAAPELIAEPVPTAEATPTPTAPVEDAENGGEENDTVIMPVKPAGDDKTGSIAPMNAGEENGIEAQAEGESVAKVGDTEYETLQEILDEAEPAEITLLGNVSEDITVYAATTINMNGYSINGSIDATDSLTLTNGTVNGNVTVDGGTFTLNAPSGAAAAINGGLNVISGSCSAR